MSDELKIHALRLEYEAACHAMQTGVGHEMQFNPGPTEPKHLRTGINAAMVDSSAIAHLLVQKGILTEMEVFTALRDAMVAEKNRYEQTLREHYGVPITLV